MKKFIFFLILFHASAGTGHALTCVPKTGNTPDDNRYLKYWGGVLETYLQCGGSGGGFHICKNGVVVEGWDGNLHKCTQQGWKTVNDIQNCDGVLEKIEQDYGGLSNLGTLFANKSHNSQWLYYYNTDEANGYTAIKNYCKYDYKEFEQKLTECKGDFLHWNDDDTVTLCDASAASSSIESAPQQSTKLARTSKEINCKNTGGDRYNAKNDLCVCNAEEKHLTQTPAQGYSICRCMDGYKRNNENNSATGECVYAPEIKTQIKRDDMAMQRDAEDAYRNEYDNAQSWANKGTTALSTLMTGEGAMMAARAIAEKIADDDAEEKMSEYVSTMKCEYGGGQSVNLGDTETLPGGNELANYYAEYKQLADKLKATKAALNLRPGIESEVLYDRAETGLYQYQTAERQSGGFTSLSRALMNPDGTDAEQWNAQRAETNRDLLVGGALATVGLAGSYIANRAINKDHVKKYKELEEKFNKIEQKLLNKYPEVFSIREDRPVIEVTEEVEEPTVPEQPVSQPKHITFDNLTAKSEAFKSGYASLTDEGTKGVADAMQLINDHLNNYVISDIKITATGHSDPEKIDSRYIARITNNYKQVVKQEYFSDMFDRIAENEQLSTARAQAVVTALLDKIKMNNPSLPWPTYFANGFDGTECKKANYSECRYVDIKIELNVTEKQK